MVKKKSEEAYNIRKEIIEIGRMANILPYEWGIRYNRIRKGKLYKDLGCKTFNEFCADPDLPIASSTAYAYIKLYEVVKKLKINPKIFEKLPSYKFRMLIPHINEKNKDELLHQALTLSKRDLRCALGEPEKSKGFKDRRSLPAVFRCKCHGLWKWDATPDEICPNCLTPLTNAIQKPKAKS